MALSTKSFALLVAAAVTLSAGTAAAEPLSVWVGQTKKMTLSVQIAKVTVDDDSILSARKDSSSVDLVGSSIGKTSLHVKTVDGDQFDFVVHVTSTGAKVYEVTAR
jgi:hypothetical protein